MFDAKPQWRILRTLWRMQTASVLLLPILVVWLMGEWEGVLSAAAIPLFALAMASLFVTLWRFRRYKLALIQAEKLGNDEGAQAAWAALHRQQMFGLLAAELPAFIGLFHYFCTGESIPLLLLVLVSLGVMALYRPPSAWVK
ncbi:MAG: MFS transporter [Halopseudomonas sp.]|uniref:MFS transporter n=1 Tax=Halopseudomonas sp. TaxID=2901191 RepID=UPI003002D2AD